MFSRLFRQTKRSLESLSEQEIVALAISSEEDDARIYLAYAGALRETSPHTAQMFEEMAREENEHRRMLIDLHVRRFGERIPLVRREYVRDFPERKPDWLIARMPVETARATDASTRKLLGDLAIAEKGHEAKARRMNEGDEGRAARAEEEQVERRQFILTYVQPGLAGLMDGSVSTLAPIFAAAFATQDTWQTFLVGLSASIGAGISMGFTEAAHDDGRISGRGSPLKRGLASGIMTAIGGLGHALPYLIPHFGLATAIAVAIVFVELWTIAFIQNRFMETPFWRAAFQVVLGGGLVFACGVLIGNA
ncbi:MAG TPA: ferritin family protein [Mycoplana sp.]|nr:ferritin family protein [Mycoplana sp.]